MRLFCSWRYYDGCSRILWNVCSSATRLHGLTIQNTKIFTVTSVRTWGPTCLTHTLVETASFTNHHLHEQQTIQYLIPWQYCHKSVNRAPFCVPCKPRYVASCILLDAERRRSTRDRSCTSHCRWGDAMMKHNCLPTEKATSILQLIFRKAQFNYRRPPYVFYIVF